MKPKFAQAVDPIFLYFIRLLDRLEAGQSVSYEKERREISRLLDKAEARLGRSPDWELAKYALIAWIDDWLIELPWEGQHWWNENSLEIEHYNSKLYHEQFFVKAREAQRLDDRDALEVYYICVVLGFKGLYRDPVYAASLAAGHGLPPDLDTWMQNTVSAIRLGQGRRRLTAATTHGQGAPPLASQSRVMGSLLGAAILLALNGILALTIFAQYSSR